MADDFQSELRQFITDRLPSLPPSERAPYESILGQLRVTRVDNTQMYFVTANLSIPNEARKLETLLAQDGVRGVAQQASHWTPEGQLVVYMALQVTPTLYATLTQVVAESPSWWRRLWTWITSFGSQPSGR